MATRILLVLTALVLVVAIPTSAQTSTIQHIPTTVGEVVEVWDGNFHRIVRIPFWVFPSRGGRAPEYVLRFPAAMYGSDAGQFTADNVYTTRASCADGLEDAQRETVRGRPAYVWDSQALSYGVQLFAGAGTFTRADTHHLHAAIQVTPGTCMRLQWTIGVEPEVWDVRSANIAREVNDSWWDEGHGVRAALRRLLARVDFRCVSQC